MDSFLRSSLHLLLFSLLLPLSLPLPYESLREAVDVLSVSGYLSMSLTLDLVGEAFFSLSPSATVFSPSDDAFVLYGQPSVSLLKLHFTPLALSLSELQAVPFGFKIPTLDPNRSLVATTSLSDDRISINNVMIDGSPVFDDAFLVIYGIDEFFDPSFTMVSPNIQSPNFTMESPIQSPSPSPSSDFQCPVYYWDLHPFGEASEDLRSRGYSIMASFLDLQLMQYDAEEDRGNFTVFAPADVAIRGSIGNMTNWASLFLRHITGCQLSCADLSGLDDGTLLSTFLKGFLINVTHFGNTVLINDVPITWPNVYRSARFLVHGIPEMLAESNEF
ncbi:hypothetical protein Dimus_014645 [Dionaea muscipula]